MNLVNGPSLTEHAMQNSDLEKRMMREIELICAVAELECLQEGKSLNNDQLNLRIGDILAPIDEELEFSFLGIIDVESATCDAAKTLADTLSAAPRGTYVILRSMGGGYDGIPHRLGYDGWMADGKGNLASHSGHKFITQSPEAFCLSPRSLYSQIWSAISYNMRNCVRDEISSATAQANAERFLGKKDIAFQLHPRHRMVDNHARGDPSRREPLYDQGHETWRFTPFQNRRYRASQ